MSRKLSSREKYDRASARGWAAQAARKAAWEAYSRACAESMRALAALDKAARAYLDNDNEE